MLDVYEIEFEDHGQDLLTLKCEVTTGEIKGAGPYHHELYADGRHFIDVTQLRSNRIVWFRNGGGNPRFFRWPMKRLSLAGAVLAEVP